MCPAFLAEAKGNMAAPQPEDDHVTVEVEGEGGVKEGAKVTEGLDFFKAEIVGLWKGTEDWPVGRSVAVLEESGGFEEGHNFRFGVGEFALIVITP